MGLPTVHSVKLQTLIYMYIFIPIHAISYKNYQMIISMMIYEL